MSRIGKKPITIPKGVTVKVLDNAVEVKGPKGQLRQIHPAGISFELSDGHLVAKLAAEDSQLKGKVGSGYSDRVEPVSERYSTHWVVMARNEEDFGELGKRVPRIASMAWNDLWMGEHNEWKDMKPAPAINVWTDDYSNLFQVFDWRKGLPKEKPVETVKPETPAPGSS